MQIYFRTNVRTQSYDNLMLSLYRHPAIPPASPMHRCTHRMNVSMHGSQTDKHARGLARLHVMYEYGILVGRPSGSATRDYECRAASALKSRYARSLKASWPNSTTSILWERLDPRKAWPIQFASAGLAQPSSAT